jgi:hypothetical protein
MANTSPPWQSALCRWGFSYRGPRWVYPIDRPLSTGKMFFLRSRLLAANKPVSTVDGASKEHPSRSNSIAGYGEWCHPESFGVTTCDNQTRNIAIVPVTDPSREATSTVCPSSAPLNARLISAAVAGSPPRSRTAGSVAAAAAFACSATSASRAFRATTASSMVIEPSVTEVNSARRRASTSIGSGAEGTSTASPETAAAVFIRSTVRAIRRLAFLSAATGATIPAMLRMKRLAMMDSVVLRLAR